MSHTNTTPMNVHEYVVYNFDEENMLYFVHDAKTSFVDTVKWYLATFGDTKGKQNKINISVSLCSYLWDIRSEMKKHARFCATVVDKVDDLISQTYVGKDVKYTTEQIAILRKVQEYCRKYAVRRPQTEVAKAENADDEEPESEDELEAEKNARPLFSFTD
jgi:hypothetical protein